MKPLRKERRFFSEKKGRETLRKRREGTKDNKGEGEKRSRGKAAVNGESHLELSCRDRMGVQEKRHRADGRNVMKNDQSTFQKEKAKRNAGR